MVLVSRATRTNLTLDVLSTRGQKKNRLHSFPLGFLFQKVPSRNLQHLMLLLFFICIRTIASLEGIITSRSEKFAKCVPKDIIFTSGGFDFDGHHRSRGQRRNPPITRDIKLGQMNDDGLFQSLLRRCQSPAFYFLKSAKKAVFSKAICSSIHQLCCISLGTCNLPLYSRKKS